LARFRNALGVTYCSGYQEEELTNDCIIRRTAVDIAIPLFTKESSIKPTPVGCRLRLDRRMP